MDITLVIARQITGNPCIIINRLCSLKFIFNGSISGSLARSRSEFFMETKSNETQEIKKKVKSKYTQKFDFFSYPSLFIYVKQKGLCRQRIIGPSWI